MSFGSLSCLEDGHCIRSVSFVQLSLKNFQGQGCHCISVLVLHYTFNKCVPCPHVLPELLRLQFVALALFHVTCLYATAPWFPLPQVKQTSICPPPHSPWPSSEPCFPQIFFQYFQFQQGLFWKLQSKYITVSKRHVLRFSPTLFCHSSYNQYIIFL